VMSKGTRGCSVIQYVSSTRGDGGIFDAIRFVYSRGGHGRRWLDFEMNSVGRPGDAQVRDRREPRLALGVN
jgi:hypothetical protein